MMQYSLLQLVIIIFLVVTRLIETLEPRYFEQPLDHFGHGPKINFRQLFYVDYGYSKKPINGPPILVFLGGEANIETWIGYPGLGPGILTLAASRFHAVIVYVEHRFYGQSIPYGSIDTALNNTNVRQFVNTDQALEDVANLIYSLKTNFSSPTSRVIVFGESYGGTLAARFMLKYPNMAIGALSSSAPMINSLDLPFADQFCSRMASSIKDRNERCYSSISKSWELIDQIALQPKGINILAEKFKACSHVFTARDLKNYITKIYMCVAQFSGITQRLSTLCDVISLAPDDNILDGVAQAVIGFGYHACNNISGVDSNYFLSVDLESQTAWDWQMCNELLPNYVTCGNNSLFGANLFNFSDHVNYCQKKYGVSPQTSRIFKDIKLVLKASRANILFSNGLMDPLSGASIRENISKTIVAINAKQGTQSMDIRYEVV